MASKRIIWGRIITLVAIILLTTYFVVSYVAIDKKETTVLFHKMEININNKEIAKLVTENDVESIVNTSGLVSKRMPLEDVPMNSIRKLLESKSYIKNVNLFTTRDGTLHINLDQRCPILRVSAVNGISFYMDDEGYIFPLSKTYVHDVPIVTGNITLPFGSSYKGNIPIGKKGDFLRNLLNFAKFVSESEYWNAEIKQIQVNNENNIELLTASAQHTIILGNLENYFSKLEKLFTFNKNFLLSEGWGNFKTLDLRFGKQVVATLKN